MGTWGAGLFEDDVAADVRDSFEAAVSQRFRLLKKTPERAADYVLHRMKDYFDDDWDDGPVAYLALAWLLREKGVKEHPVILQAHQILDEKKGLSRWEEAGPEALQERLDVYAEIQRYLQD